MNLKTSIAVISDLHVGEAARAEDLNPQPASTTCTEKHYIETFKQFVQSRALRADLLVIPGDITNHAKPEEFRLASKQIKRIAEALNLSTNRILFVPGNHDVDWEVLKLGAADPVRRRQRYDPLQQPDELFYEVLQRASVNKITHEDSYCIWQYPDYLVIGLNSAFHDTPSASPHHGLIPLEVLTKLDAELKMFPKNKAQLRLAIVHHHPVNYSDPIANEPDFSAMTNVESFLKLLEAHDIDIVIHGHKHVPKFDVHQVSSYFQLPILGAGSFSSRLDSRWNGLVNNQFHLIEIDTRDPSTAQACGILRSFTYLCGHGWCASAKNSGIAHKIYFGGFSSEGSLEPPLSAAITATFQTAAYIRLEELLQSRDDFRYVPSSLVHRVLKKLAKQLKFVVHPGESSTLLLKE
jgi:3',5'-cyclic AMP phosphodiesterase CpdA